MTIIDTTGTEFTTILGLSATGYAIADNVDDLATSLTSTGTTLSTNNVDINVEQAKKDVNETTAYIESLTDEELSELSKRLEEKEFEIVEVKEQQENKSDQKVYKK